MRLWTPCRLLTLLALYWIGTASVIHASTWIEVSNARFEIVTDAGEAAARQLVNSLAQFDGAIAHSIGSSPAFEQPSGPVRFYLFRSEGEFAELRNESWATGITFASSQHTAPSVALFAGPMARETAIHEYVHVLVRRGDWKLALWFEEGLAEFYARSQPAGRDQLSVGRRVPEHLAQLTNQSLTPAMFIEEPRPATHLRFYAASWALVHMLLMDPRYRDRTGQLLAAGTWDSSFTEVLKDLQQYVARPIWKEATVLAPKASVLDLKVTPIGQLDAEFMLADLLLDARRPDAARKRYQKIAAAHPRDPAGAEAAGLAAMAAGQMDLARREFHRAVDLKSTRARIWSDLASLDREAGADWRVVKPLLERAAELDPADYQAAFLLGVRESDNGNWKEAALDLAAAAQAAPGRPDVWHAYALALSKAGRFEDARLAAKRALRVAATPEWERAASVLVASLDRRGGAVKDDVRVRRKPEVVTSPAWNRPVPDTEIEGRFVEFVCQADQPRFRIEVEGGRVLELKVGDPGQVTILNSAPGEVSIELKCGPQDRRPIRIGYRRSDGMVLEVKLLQVLDPPRF